MCLSSENKQFDGDSLIDFFKFNASEEGSEKQTTYSKAVNSLVSFLQSRGASMLPDPETAICDWTVYMCVCGVSLKTALPYLNAIAGLYKKAVGEGLAPSTDVFARIRSQLKESGDTLWKSWLKENDFERLRSITRAGQRLTDVRKLVLYSLTRDCMPLAEAARVKIDDMPDAELELLGISRSQFSGNRKYVFSLDLTGLTPAQLARTVNSTVLALLEQCNISHTPSADDTLRSYRAYAALRMGVAPHTVRSLFKVVPSGFPILSICQDSDISEESRRQISGSISEMFIVNPPKWYVMRLRPRVRFDELEKKLDGLRGELPAPELFYPCEEIYRRTGKKNAVVQKPVIPDIVFFKSRETDLYPMFLKIGDIAWAYKTDGRGGNRYAAIPKRAFERFQETIGQFTPDYEVATIGELTPRVGDEIVVIGGLFQSQEGILTEIEGEDGNGNRIYRIEITPPNAGQVWKIGIDARIVRKKNAAHN